jgi:hypothetical protein
MTERGECLNGSLVQRKGLERSSEWANERSPGHEIVDLTDSGEEDEANGSARKRRRMDEEAELQTPKEEPKDSGEEEGQKLLGAEEGVSYTFKNGVAIRFQLNDLDKVIETVRKIKGSGFDEVLEWQREMIPRIVTAGVRLGITGDFLASRVNSELCYLEDDTLMVEMEEKEGLSLNVKHLWEVWEKVERNRIKYMCRLFLLLNCQAREEEEVKVAVALLELFLECAKGVGI